MTRGSVGGRLLTRSLLTLATTVCTAHIGGAREILVTDRAQFAAAVKSAKPGDSILLADGEWRDFQMVFTGEGQPDRPLTLAAQTKGKVLLTGQSNLRLGGQHLVVSGLVFRDGYSPTGEVIAFRRDSTQLASHSRVTDVVIDGFSKPDRRAEDIWVALYGTGNRIDHSHFEGKTNAGVTVAVIRGAGQQLENRHRIDHNYFGPRPPLGSNGGETIRIGTSEESLSDSRTIVERNIFDRCSGEVEIVSVKAGGNILRGNLVLESQGAFVLRHGNGNLVERNVFLGRHVPDTGGVRVINRDQIVRDNYFEGLAGEDFTSAIAVMNGVPDSAINRYHQVSGALIERNTIVDSVRITLAAGADTERSAPPVDSRFERNLIVGANGVDPFRVDGDISGIAFAGNVAGTVANPQVTAGFERRDVALARAANGLLYPTDPASVPVGAPRDLKPVTRGEVGAAWYQAFAREADFGSGRTIRVTAGASLAEAVATSGPGDTLAFAPGEYRLAAPLAVRHRLTLAGSPDARTTLRVSAGLVRIKAGGGLRLENLDVDATGVEENPALVDVGSRVAPNYRLAVHYVSVRGPGPKAGLTGIAIAPGTFADAITITGSRFADMATVIAASGEQTSNGWYPVERLSIEGSRFDRVGLVVDLLRRGTDESTFGPRFVLANSNVADSGAGDASLRLSGVQHADITGNAFTGSAPLVVIHSVGTPRTRIAGNRFIATPAPRIEELTYKGPPRAKLSDNMVEAGR